MNNQKIYGISIIFGSVMSIITMALHPVGGNIEHLINVSPVIVGTHTLGIASLPFMTFGFLGLTQLLRKKSIYADAGFVVFAFANIAALFAALFNGLVVPSLVNNYASVDEATLEIVRVTLSNNFYINAALDYVFIVGVCVSALLWSISIITTRTFSKWISGLGIVMGVTAIVSVVTGFTFISLTGFRVFIFGYVFWTILLGIFLIRMPQKGDD